MNCLYNRKYMAKKTLEEEMAEIRRKQEEDEAKRLAEKFGLDYVNLARIPINQVALNLVSKKEAQAAQLAVIQKKGKKLTITLADPDDSDVEPIIQKLESQGYKIQKIIVSQSSLKRAWSFYEEKIKEKAITGQVTIAEEAINRWQKEIKGIAQIKQKIAQLADQKTSEVVELVLAAGLKTEASDIHFEPKQDNVGLRYRVDGILYDSGAFTPDKYNLILSRVKLLSNLKLNVHDKPQDGRFSIEVKPQPIEIRTSILPGPNGEAIVLRILNPKTIGLALQDLGFRQDELPIIEREIKKTTGLILTTGPTGSGKTTTLYACLKKISTPEINVITVEDPIEYHLTGINQTQVKPQEGYDFATALRSIMRHDPDVILIGEVRDRDTATIAVNAALTGHLVLSTVHTNDAAGAVPRLLDLGASSTNLPAALDLVMAQRLVRRICTKCAKKIKLGAENFSKIKTALAGIPEKVKLPEFNENSQILQASEKGCLACNQTGYKGRVAVFELFVVDDEMEKLISRSPTHAEMLEAAKQRSMTTMIQDGLIKVLSDLTTIEEIERVLGTI